MKERLLIIDGSSMLATNYYANLPNELKVSGLSDEEKEVRYDKLLRSPDGRYTNALFGMTKQLSKILSKAEASHIAICWDISKNTFRKQMFPDYKGNRSATPRPLKEQFFLAQEFFAAMGIKQFSHENYEADDFAGSISKKFSKEIDTALLTKDQDYLQLIEANVAVWMPVGQKNIETLQEKSKSVCEGMDKIVYVYRACNVMEIYGLTPKQVIDWKAIAGDKSDNIPGIAGIGDVSAKKILSKFESLKKAQIAVKDGDNVALSNWMENGLTKSVFNKILTDMETTHQGKISYQLAKIKTDIPINETLSDLKLFINAEAYRNFCVELGFTSIVKMFDKKI